MRQDWQALSPVCCPYKLLAFLDAFLVTRVLSSIHIVLLTSTTNSFLICLKASFWVVLPHLVVETSFGFGGTTLDSLNSTAFYYASCYDHRLHGWHMSCPFWEYALPLLFVLLNPIPIFNFFFCFCPCCYQSLKWYLRSFQTTQKVSRSQQAW